MSSRTPRISLYKPADNGSENVNVATNINDNLEILDALMSFVPVTSGTYPASGYQGEAFVETDTNRTWVNIGVSGSALSLVEIANGTGSFGQSSITMSSSAAQIKTGGTSAGATLSAQRAAATDLLLSGRTIGTSASSMYTTAINGQQEWGPGTTATDTNLYRSAADTLKTDDSFIVGTNLTVSGSSTLDDAIIGGNLVIGSTTHRPNLSTVTTVASSSAEAVLASQTIPAGDAVVGAVYRIKAWGTAAVTGTPTMTFRARLGGLAGTQMAAHAAITVRSGATDGMWRSEFLVSCVATGASGTWDPMLESQHNFLTSATTFTPLGPNVVAPVTRDTTVANDMVITGQWSASSPSNTITCRGFAAERVA